eukprot:3141836-Rhodomonas_salina.1
MLVRRRVKMSVMAAMQHDHVRRHTCHSSATPELHNYCPEHRHYRWHHATAARASITPSSPSHRPDVLNAGIAMGVGP